MNSDAIVILIGFLVGGIIFLPNWVMVCLARKCEGMVGWSILASLGWMGAGTLLLYAKAVKAAWASGHFNPVGDSIMTYGIGLFFIWLPVLFKVISQKGK